MHWSVFAWSALAIAVVMISTWVVSLFLRNASIVDPIWSLGFVVVGWVSFAAMHQHVDALRTGVLLTFVTIWGVRLSLHLFIRNFGHGEDYRYKAMRKKHGAKFWLVSLGTVYVFQGILMWIVSLPLQFGIGTSTKTSWWVLPLVLGAIVWLIGFAFESIGDAQLKAFKADPASAGQVMDRGLWRYTRHPNYFGDACTWWGIWLIACETGLPGWISIIGPIFLTFTLTRWSGKPMLEYGMKKTRPGYAEYVARTSGFFPLPPKSR